MKFEGTVKELVDLVDYYGYARPMEVKDTVSIEEVADILNEADQEVIETEATLAAHLHYAGVIITYIDVNNIRCSKVVVPGYTDHLIIPAGSIIIEVKPNE